MMNWIKALHVLAIIMWMGNLMITSRLIIDYLGQTNEEVKKYIAMRCHRMYQFISLPAMLIAVTLGLILISGVELSHKPRWFHMKITLILGLIFMDLFIGKAAGQMSRGELGGKPGKWHGVHGTVALLMLGILVSLFVVRDQPGEWQVKQERLEVGKKTVVEL